MDLAEHASKQQFIVKTIGLLQHNGWVSLDDLAGQVCGRRVPGRGASPLSTVSGF